MQLLLTRYAMERLLYRLGISTYKEQFVLKGAMLFSLWAAVPYRATADVDLLGFGDDGAEQMAAVFREICVLSVDDDGVIFEPETLRSDVTRIADRYGGVRLSLVARVGKARLTVRVDIGFGDAVTPGAQEIEFPSLLDMPTPRLRAYPPETVVAEKFQAIVALGMMNSRMKDFFDLWAMAETFSFDGTVLAEAIRATFERRQTVVPAETPIALTPDFAEDGTKQSQWRGFLRRTAIDMAPGPFAELQGKVGRGLRHSARIGSCVWESIQSKVGSWRWLAMRFGYPNDRHSQESRRLIFGIDLPLLMRK